MEITLAQERAFQLLPHVRGDQARALAEERKVSLVAGTFGSLFTRPKPDEIQLTYAEHRLEPLWRLSGQMRTVYDRQRPYTLTAAGTEVKQLTLLGQTLPVESREKGGPVVTLMAVEHCEEDQRFDRIFDSQGAQRPEWSRYLTFAAEEIPDLVAFQPEGVIVVAPETRAAAVTRQVMAEVVRPIKAQVIHEERVTLDAIDLYFRPSYAFEYHWAAKGKRVVIECDGLTGEIRTGGATFQDQFRKVMNREVLFDISAEAVGAVIPGGGIAIRLAKAVVDRNRD